LPKPLDKTTGHILPQLSESFSKQQETRFILGLKAPNQQTNLELRKFLWRTFRRYTWRNIGKISVEIYKTDMDERKGWRVRKGEQ
jgi:hypothetical protein